MIDVEALASTSLLLVTTTDEAVLSQRSEPCFTVRPTELETHAWP